jgi:hypothetical protein
MVLLGSPNIFWGGVGGGLLLGRPNINVTRFTLSKLAFWFWLGYHLFSGSYGENPERKGLVMIFGRSRLTGTYFAECEDCDFISVYWECEEDLEHKCYEDISVSAWLSILRERGVYK